MLYSRFILRQSNSYSPKYLCLQNTGSATNNRICRIIIRRKYIHMKSTRNPQKQ